MWEECLSIHFHPFFAYCLWSSDMFLSSLQQWDYLAVLCRVFLSCSVVPVKRLNFRLPLNWQINYFCFLYMVTLEIRVNDLSEKSSHLLHIYFIQYLLFSHRFVSGTLRCCLHILWISTFQQSGEAWSLNQAAWLLIFKWLLFANFFLRLWCFGRLSCCPGNIHKALNVSLFLLSRVNFY